MTKSVENVKFPWSPCSCSWLVVLFYPSNQQILDCRISLTSQVWIKTKRRSKLNTAKWFYYITLQFYRANSYASAVLGVEILSARLFVRSSVTRVLCDKTKHCTVDIVIPHERAMTLVFWHRQWLVGDAPSVWNLRSKWPTRFKKRRLRQISAYNVSTVSVRDSEKSLITPLRAVQRDMDSAYMRTLSLSPPKSGSKAFFLFFNKLQFRSNSLLHSFFVWKHQASCSRTIPSSNGK